MNLFQSYQILRSLGYTGVFQILKYRIWRNQKVFIEDFYNYNLELREQLISDSLYLKSIEWNFHKELNLEILTLNFFTERVTFEGEKIISLPRKQEEIYWKTLRRWIGHNVVYSPSCVIIIEQNGKILLVQRADDGHWSLPAGAKEIGDTLKQTVQKEAYEEVGIQVFDLELIAIQTGKKMFWKYPNGNQMHFISFVWKAKTLDSPKINDLENTDWKWLEPQKAFEILEQRWRIRLTYYQNFKGNIILS